MLMLMLIHTDTNTETSLGDPGADDRRYQNPGAWNRGFV